MAKVSRMALEAALAIGKAVKPNLSTAWQYAKVECIPPGTQWFFHGRLGKQLEDTVGGTVDRFISGVERQISDMDAAVIREQQEKEAKIKAEQEKLKAAEALKRQEAAKKSEEAKKAKEATAKKEAETKAKEEEKAKTEAKKAPEPKKPPPPAKK